MIARSQTDSRKRELRRIARTIRADISATERTAAALAVADHLMAHLSGAQIGTAAAYHPINDEIDPLPAMMPSPQVVKQLLGSPTQVQPGST